MIGLKLFLFLAPMNLAWNRAMVLFAYALTIMSHQEQQYDGLRQGPAWGYFLSRNGGNYGSDEDLEMSLASEASEIWKAAHTWPL